MWMFCKKDQYLKLHEIHHKALQVVFNNDVGYDEVSQRNNEVSIHQKRILTLIYAV